jgi:5-methylcytosine-specific restriction endonuclease McrA
MDEKKCIICRQWRPLEDFPKDQSRKSGKYPRCSPCRAADYQANRERYIAQMREYRQRPGIVERISLQRRKYAERRFFHITANNLKVRAKVKDAAATTAEISRLWKNQRGICPVSGRRLNKENAQLDHIVPLKQGGSDLVENLRWVHRDVNYAKRDLLDEDFFRLCQDIIANLKFKP